MDREAGNQGTTTPEPHKISHKSSYKSQQLDMSSCYLIVRPQGFMAAQRSYFIKQGRPAVAFHTIVRRRTRCIPTSDQALCPVGIPRRKAASKADKRTTNVPLWQGSLGYVLFGTGSGLSCIATSFIYNQKAAWRIFCYLYIYFIPNFAPQAIVTV